MPGAFTDELMQCMNDNVRERRMNTSQKIMEDNREILECVKNKGVELQIWGSTKRQVATETSDLDAWAEYSAENEKALEACGFRRKPAETCGAYNKYKHPDKKIDATLRHPCEMSHGTKWDLVPDDTNEEIKDVLFCINSLRKPFGEKVFHHGDALLSKGYKEHGIKKKRQL